MPKHKQPVPLQKLAFDFLLETVVDYCDDNSVEGYLGRFRLAIADIKRHIHGHIPSLIFAEFCRKFLDEFYSLGEKRGEKRRSTHYRAALEIMMDEKIVGLTCGGDILHHLSYEDSGRIHGLKIIDWTSMVDYEFMHPCLNPFNLQDLTIFICPSVCSDYDLGVIGSCCPKLKVLMIQESDEVTNKGLRALSSCSELRIINLSYCSVTDIGINELLSVNLKLEEFNLGRCSPVYEAACFNVLSRENALVCSSVKRFAIRCGVATDDEHLHSVVALFPNLTRLEFYRPLKCDLCILKGLRNLTELEFNQFSTFSLENLKELLTIIGENISVLVIGSVGLTKKDLNFIFKTCENIERLEFEYEPRYRTDRLDMPPFKKLKTLKCLARSGNSVAQGHEFCQKLEFGIMLALEILIFYGFSETDNIIESIMFDNVKFPNLREVRAFSRHNEYMDCIELLAKNTNLDFSLGYIKM